MGDLNDITNASVRLKLGSAVMAEEMANMWHITAVAHREDAALPGRVLHQAEGD